MNVHDEHNKRALRVASDIRKFQAVENFDDYVKIRSRMHRSVARVAGNGRRARLALLLNSPQVKTKLEMLAAVSGILVALVAIATLIVTIFAR